MSNAAEHADSMIGTIRYMSDNGAPFGLINSDTEEWSDDRADYADYLNNEETEWQEASAMDYLSDVLDIQYIVGSDRTYRAARVCVGIGGPNVWLNTQTSNLEVSWWSAPEYRDLPSDFVDGLDEALEELWDMGA